MRSTSSRCRRVAVNRGHVVPPGLLGSLGEQVEHVAGKTPGEVVNGTDGSSPGRVVAGPDEEGHVTDGQSSEHHAVQVGQVEPGRRPGHEEQRRGRGTPQDRGLQERERLGARLVGVLHDDDPWAAPGANDGVGEGVGECVVECVVEDGGVDPGAAFRAGCLHPPLPQEGVASVPEAPDRLDDRPVVVPLVDESPDGGGDERGLPHARGPLHENGGGAYGVTTEVVDEVVELRGAPEERAVVAGHRWAIRPVSSRSGSSMSASCPPGAVGRVLSSTTTACGAEGICWRGTVVTMAPKTAAIAKSWNAVEMLMPAPMRNPPTSGPMIPPRRPNPAHQATPAPRARDS